MSRAIEVNGLRKRFGSVVAVDGLDLFVERGECFGLLGPNGAGKTTTIEILEGLTQRDEGDVRVLGRRWEDDPIAIRQRIGVSLQETQLSEKLKVVELLTLFGSFYPASRPASELLTEFALNEKANARFIQLSGGQKQRLAVAIAMVGNPELVFLDEPTTGLDPQSRLQLWEHIARFRARGHSILLTTHYMDEAERLCDRIAIVDHGRKIAEGTPRELIASLEGTDVIEIVTVPPLPVDDVQAIRGVRGSRPKGDALNITVDSLAESVPPLLALAEQRGSIVSHLSTHRATLEDVFVSLTGRELRDA